MRTLFTFAGPMTPVLALAALAGLLVVVLVASGLRGGYRVRRTAQAPVPRELQRVAVSTSKQPLAVVAVASSRDAA